MPTVSPFYGTMISPRSRRLRTVALLLLGVVLAMTAYGALVLMPSAQSAVRRHHVLLEKDRRHAIAAPGMTPEQVARDRRVAKAVELQVVAADCYWGLCGLVLVALIGVSWLDVREVSRTYMSQRLAMWSDVAANAGRNDRGIE